MRKPLQCTRRGYKQSLAICSPTWADRGVFQIRREEEASKQAAEVMKLHPKFSLDDFGKIFHLKDQSIADDYLASLRKRSEVR